MDEVEQIKDFRAAIGQILGIYESSQEFVVSGEDAERMAMLHGLLAHSFEMTRAALLLIDKKQWAASAVLSRVAFEHAVFAQWAHLHPNGLNGLSQAEVLSYRKLFNGLKEGFNFRQEFKDFYGQEMKKPEKVASEVTWFEGMCNSFIAGENLYFIYRLLSGYVHPSNLTGRLYRDFPENGGPITLRWHAQHVGLIPELQSLALSVALASWIYEDLREGKPRLGEIQSIAAGVGVEVPLVLKPIEPVSEES